MSGSLDKFVSGGSAVSQTIDAEVDTFGLASLGDKINRTPSAGNYFVLTLDGYNSTTSNAEITVTVGGRTVINSARIADLLWAARTTSITLIGGIDESVTVTVDVINGGQFVFYNLSERG